MLAPYSVLTAVRVERMMLKQLAATQNTRMQKRLSKYRRARQLLQQLRQGQSSDAAGDVPYQTALQEAAAERKRLKQLLQQLRSEQSSDSAKVRTVVQQSKRGQQKQPQEQKPPVQRAQSGARLARVDRQQGAVVEQSQQQHSRTPPLTASASSQPQQQSQLDKLSRWQLRRHHLLLQQADAALQDVEGQVQQHVSREREHKERQRELQQKQQRLIQKQRWQQQQRQQQSQQQQGVTRRHHTLYVANLAQQRQVQHQQHELHQQQGRQQRERPALLRQVAVSLQEVARMLDSAGLEQHTVKAGSRSSGAAVDARPQPHVHSEQCDELRQIASSLLGVVVSQQQSPPTPKEDQARREALVKLGPRLERVRAALLRVD